MAISSIRSAKFQHCRFILARFILTASVDAFISPCITPQSRFNALRASSRVTAISPRLNSYPPIPTDLIECFSPKEWEQRCSLAVAYRIAYLHSWHENIFNHITLKVEGSENYSDGPYFLLNDFGIGFDEITACNLLKVNLDGMVLDTIKPIPAERRDINSGEGRVFKPGYVLHSAIHAVRHDVYAVWHGHDLDASAVSQTKFGILPLSQEATYVLNKGLSYHPFEGSANDLSEQPRLVANLGPTNQMLLLEDHGPIVACPTLEEAFAGMYFLTRACKYQIKSLSAAGGDLSKIHLPDDTTMNEMVKRMEMFDEAPLACKEDNVKSSDQTSENGSPAEVMHDTPGLMFAYARRTAEKTFGLASIYR
ncbi:hypothetical protein HJC23_008415 [Cyclotella cryptica]|uniref:Class II aldolase/adducin N-terminal domain-containing protein n=1 Tax=Cyclotella cryptica TaxID=29204 RepID=A0ABD3PWW8_9STRA|eukprot:CCRYP_010715-RA/>CCRYP_010715-RA protein AED:0.39 eAED:0.39 QI:0/-1/0/1/-1/1/1/0/365